MDKRRRLFVTSWHADNKGNSILFERCGTVEGERNKYGTYVGCACY